MKFLHFFIPFLIFLFVSSPIALALSSSELIKQKTEELRQIQVQREVFEKSLNELRKNKESLNRELKIINANTDQLNLLLKGNKIILEKLDLEINDLQDEIEDLRKKIDGDKYLLAKILIELQQRDHQNFLVLFLKNKNLTEGFNEVQSLIALNHHLSDGLTQAKLNSQLLNQKLSELKEKREQKKVEQLNLKERQLIIEDQKKEKENLLALTKNQEKIYSQELEKLIEKQKAIANEIEKIEFELRQKINPNLLPPSGVLLWPVSGMVSQDYGFTDFARYGYRGHFHNGIDIAAPLGTPVFAAESGKVIASGDQDRYCYRGAYGKFIVIRHENNLTTLYAHLSRQVVGVGDIIKKGELIGYVGHSGYATGDHLHFTVYASQTFYLGSSRMCGPMPFGGDLNPMVYLEKKN